MNIKFWIRIKIQIMEIIENTFLILCECGIDIIHRNFFRREDIMEKRKNEKKQYKKPELTKHEKLSILTGESQR